MSSRTPTDEMILAYAAGELDAEQSAAVERYLSESPEAARMAARYRVAAERLRTDHSVEPPPHVLERAKAVFQAPAPAAAPGWLDRLDAWIARLVFDSRVQLAGVRRAGAPSRLQLSFEHESLMADLRAQREHDVREESEQQGQITWRVMGQFSGEPPAAGVRLRLVDAESGRTVANAVADESEMFEFEAPRGRFDLCAELPSGLLVLPQIELQ